MAVLSMHDADECMLAALRSKARSEARCGRQHAEYRLQNLADPASGVEQMLLL